MAMQLLRLYATGPGKRHAEVEFSELSTLIYGPSDTGKSHIFKALNYLLGSDTAPDNDVTEAQGYTSFALEVEGSLPDQQFTIFRGAAGGGATVHRGKLADRSDDNKTDADPGELLRLLSGVQEKIIYRKVGQTGNVTPGSLRHWSLLSETSIGSDTTFLGDTSGRTMNAATVSLLITGNDDSDVQPGTTTVDKERARGGKDAIEMTISRLSADIPEGATLIELKDSLSRVDRVFKDMNSLHLSRSSNLKATRELIGKASARLRKAEDELSHKAAMLDRFVLLDQKYHNDLQRLVAVDEGIAFFGILDEVPCPLCGTSMDAAHDANHDHSKANELQRIALAAEAEKIRRLQRDLQLAIETEKTAIGKLAENRAWYLGKLAELEKDEQQQISITQTEFNVSPEALAKRRSELYAHISALEEIEKLKAEAARLGELSKRKAAAIARAFGENQGKLEALILENLHAWGFDRVITIAFDTKNYDITINGRRRLSFGMGTRSVFMTAYAIAIMQHSLSIGAPHPGFLVIDSPLKTYYEKRNVKPDDPAVPVETVKERFYKWLMNWSGPGQLVIMENSMPPASLRSENWTEFTDDDLNGRQGFYYKDSQDDLSDLV